MIRPHITFSLNINLRQLIHPVTHTHLNRYQTRRPHTYTHTQVRQQPWMTTHSPAESHTHTIYAPDDRIRTTRNGKQIIRASETHAIMCGSTYRSLLVVMVPLMRTIEPDCMPPGICARCGTLWPDGGTDQQQQKTHAYYLDIGGIGFFDRHVCVWGAGWRWQRKLLRKYTYHIVDGQRRHCW